MMINIKTKSMPMDMTAEMLEASYPALLKIAPDCPPERIKRAAKELWRLAAASAPRPNVGGLTRKQKIIHEVICDYVKQHGISPTYEEIKDMTGWKSRGDVFRIARAVARRGYISIQDGRKRSIQIIKWPGEN